MSLNSQMRAFQHAFTLNADPGIVDAFQRAQSALADTGIVDRALKAGFSMPEFTLFDLSGQAVSLHSLLVRGPVVVSFYPGDWCDYCVMELAALAAIHDEVLQLGASLVAVSPQAPQTRPKSSVTEPPFPLLFDAEAKVARRCGIAFPLSEELRPIYTGAGRRPSSEGQDNWLLPLPATYIVDWTGEIVFSFLDTDYTSRLEPAEILAVLAPLARRTDREQPVWGRRRRRTRATRGGDDAPLCDFSNPTSTRTR